MRGEDLSREQFERLEREVERQHHYYVLLWKRAQANDMPLQDPLVRGICDAWAWINHLAQTIERLKARLPQPYRPLVEPTKQSGLASVELPWAEHQRRMAEACEAERRKPQPPDVE